MGRCMAGCTGGYIGWTRPMRKEDDNERLQQQQQQQQHKHQRTRQQPQHLQQQYTTSDGWPVGQEALENERHTPTCTTRGSPGGHIFDSANPTSEDCHMNNDCLLQALPCSLTSFRPAKTSFLWCCALPIDSRERRNRPISPVERVEGVFSPLSAQLWEDLWDDSCELDLWLLRDGLQTSILRPFF